MGNQTVTVANDRTCSPHNGDVTIEPGTDNTTITWKKKKNGVPVTWDFQSIQIRFAGPPPGAWNDLPYGPFVSLVNSAEEIEIQDTDPAWGIDIPGFGTTHPVISYEYLITTSDGPVDPKILNKSG